MSKDKPENLFTALQARITELETITDERVERVAIVLCDIAFEGYYPHLWFEFVGDAKAVLQAAIGGDDESND